MECKMTNNTTAFIGGNVFIGDGRVLENASVIIEDKLINKVAKGSISIPKMLTKSHLPVAL